jgi:protein-disulfide isomerase
MRSSWLAFIAALGVLVAGMARSADLPARRPLPVGVVQAIIASPSSLPVRGNPKGDLTLVEFFDYNCPYCRKLDPVLEELLKSDAKVKLIQRDFPIFGQASVYAAYCAMAAAGQGKYVEVHRALIGSKRNLNSKENVEATLSEAGFDVKALAADIALHQKEYSAALDRNLEATKQLGVRGTPVLIIGHEQAVNTPTVEELRALVAHARAS